MKTKTLLALVAAAVLMGSVSSAMARSHDLVNQALDKTLNERARVERSYEQKMGGRPADDFREKNGERKIEVVMDGEIGGRGGRIRDLDRSDRTFRERNVEARLDREAKEIDRSLEREARAERSNSREREVRAYGDRARRSRNE
ncbi:MAG: hypothetical protein V4760_04630 [Bdellovibrionota bacterium]